MAQVGLKDVARAAGVSYKTVSRVVNGEAPVSNETRRRVEEAVAHLGYRPNHSARSLRRGRTQTLRLIMFLGKAHVRQERFQDDVVAAVIDRAAAMGYSVLLELAHGDEDAAQLARHGDRRSDGTVLLDGRAASPIVPVLVRSATPAVAMVNPDADPGLASVDADFAGGADAMVGYLIAQGHRRIAHIGDDPVIHSSRGRRAGYVRALQRAGIEVDETLIEVAGPMRHHGHAAAERLLDRAPDLTAFFCVNDLSALGAIECLRSRGRRVPEDASVTGYDDIAAARYSTPPLTTVRIPWYEMAETAAAHLIDAIEGRAEFPFRREFPVEVTLRGTTGPAPAG